ncbi:MAG TPA: YggT family protein [Jatrophihabitantaceae bacterium]|jgi:YggT family protein
MTLVWSVVALVLYLYFLMIVARVVIDVTRQFARSWRPAGVAAIGLEAVYSSTDPPVKLFRRLIPPVRLGPVSLDLSVWILLIAILALRWLALSLAS